jgi:aminoglycoside 6'-N-acetyltransferase
VPEKVAPARGQHFGVGASRFAPAAHHRITIDPAAANSRAIRCYEKAGFRPVGVMRQYERGADGQFHDGLMMDLLRGDLPIRAGER